MRTGAQPVAPDAIYDVECDIFSPCALGATVNAGTIPRLRALGVADSANNQLATPEDGESLARRGIVYAPDYAANAGGLVAIVGIESLGWTQAELDARLRRVKTTVLEVVARAAQDRICPEQAADRMVEERLAA